MKDTKLPHFPFFARDWLTDERVMLMPLEVQGAYLRLLCYQWLEGSLPRNPKNLAALCLTSPEHFDSEIWPTLSDCFDEVSVERLQNPRLEAIKVETEALIAKKSENGKRGAAKRWKNGDTNSPPLVTHSDTNAIHIHSHIQKDDGDRASGVLNEDSAKVYELLMFQFRYGHLKALHIAETLGTTMEDLADWQKYEDVKGTKLARFNMKTFKNPREIPAEKKGTDNQRKTFTQMDEDEYARKKAEFDKEKENDDVSGNKQGA